jgi:hypothetical protein
MDDRGDPVEAELPLGRFDRAMCLFSRWPATADALCSFVHSGDVIKGIDE